MISPWLLFLSSFQSRYPAHATSSIRTDLNVFIAPHLINRAQQATQSIFSQRRFGHIAFINNVLHELEGTETEKFNGNSSDFCIFITTSTGPQSKQKAFIRSYGLGIRKENHGAPGWQTPGGTPSTPRRIIIRKRLAFVSGEQRILRDHQDTPRQAILL